ncbi:Ribonuclease 3 [Methylacidimicrobium cyclopophantes]|uniref:Ribonuclease 3 n=1 Tax=Methylacidimicrobium cyclopophantes TaxID=1041766 RepID=A0A5E6MAF5_9BACT|nr:ribonuclease III [Methylacidimicrobium cyclopophantes]VVM05949.1 Ribonuclease 3 [Methylacidimicrobium cyclopophantes]
MDIATFQKIICHDFRNADLLREALTHPSYAAERRSAGPNYQRLEFLGDAVLQLAITDLLHARFPLHREGLLTKMRSFLVNRSTLAGIAKELGVGELLLLGKGEEKSGGRAKESNLADSLEAVIGAVYRDSGWRKSKVVVRKLFAHAIGDLASSPGALLENPKGRLQELLQKQGGDPPRYRCVSQSGAAHRKWYNVVVEWGDKRLGEGSGSSKKEAELTAASDALSRIAPDRLPGSPCASLRTHQ